MTPGRTTVSAAALGAADTALFLARRRSIFRDAPGRAAGSVGGLVAWSALVVSAAGDRDRAGRRTVGLAAGVLAMNMALLGVHLRHRIAGPRVWIGTALAATAFGAALSGR